MQEHQNHTLRSEWKNSSRVFRFLGLPDSFLSVNKGMSLLTLQEGPHLVDAEFFTSLNALSVFTTS